MFPQQVAAGQPALLRPLLAHACNGTFSPSSSYSSGWVTLKTIAAAAPPMNSKSMYTKHRHKLPPKKMRATPMPNDTAGFSEPPEMMPIARPPTVTHEPMMKPVNSAPGAFFVVATQRTTYVKTKVKAISAVATPIQPNPLPGPMGKVTPPMISAYVKAPAKPATIWTPMYLPADPPSIFSRPLSRIATVTAGLKWAPDTSPHA